MRSFLLSLSVNGVKNIEKPITIDFYSKIIKRFTPCKNNIKGIFGPNGIGKTAIIKSIDIIRKLVINDKYLSNDNNIIILDKIINKTLNYMEVEVDFLSIGENGEKTKFRHFIKLSKSLQKIYIEEEKIIKLDRESNIILKELIIKKGTILKNDFFNSESNEELKNRTANLLLDRSVLNVLLSDFSWIKSKLVLKDFMKIFNFYADVFVKIESNDDHSIYATIENNFNKLDKIIPRLESNYDIIVSKNDYNSFLVFLKNLTEFLKLFKPELKNISCESKLNVENYYINIILEYESYNVDLEFESMGIKSLVALFSYFECIYNDKIVFIDEIDINIHDVYLNKLIEFFAEEGRGQLIFTAHNITLLQTLKDYKHSIDFINENKEIVSWTRKGNSNPFKVYKEGYIKGLPFNIEESNFYSIFANKEDD